MSGTTTRMGGDPAFAMPAMFEDADIPPEDRHRAWAIATEQRAGERMMLAAHLPGLSGPARRVVQALAYRGWISDPSQKLLGVDACIDPDHLSTPLRDLKAAGFLHTAKKRTGPRDWEMTYTFAVTPLIEVQKALEAAREAARTKRVNPSGRGVDSTKSTPPVAGLTHKVNPSGRGVDRHGENSQPLQSRGWLTSNEPEEEEVHIPGENHFSSSSSGAESTPRPEGLTPIAATVRKHWDGPYGLGPDRVSSRGWDTEAAAVAYYTRKPAKLAADLENLERQERAASRNGNGKSGNGRKTPTPEGLREYLRKRGRMPEGVA